MLVYSSSNDTYPDIRLLYTNKLDDKSYKSLSNEAKIFSCGEFLRSNQP